MTKNIIMYFSLSGNTRKAALALQKKTSGDLFEIETKIPYPDTYEEYSVIGMHQLENNIELDLKQELPNLDDYDFIFLGYPTWSQQPPMIIHTVLKDAKLNGKTIVPFTTSMSTGIDESVKVIKDLTKDSNLKIEDGFRYSNNQFLGKTDLI